MSTLEAERDIKMTVQTTEAVEFIDCGRASEQTRGLPLFLLYEGSLPPIDKFIL